MSPEQLRRIDWIRAATLANMLLCQALSDEAIDELVRRAPAQPVAAPRAA
jgi:ribosomal protein L12E/L44/L45/RPP1/RPP2